MKTPNKLTISNLDILAKGDEESYLEALNQVSAKVGGLTNIKTFADFKNVEHAYRLKGSFSREYLSVDTFREEVPGYNYTNNRSSINPLDHDFSTIYQDPSSSSIPATVNNNDSSDYSKQVFPSYTGPLLGSVETFKCKPELPCPSCQGNGRCATCKGSGVVYCYSCNGSGRCAKCAGQGRFLCSSCHGIGYDEARRQCSRCGGSGQERCLSCGGSGVCRRCNSCGRVGCLICDGNGECTNCRGVGTIVCKRCQGTGYYQRLLKYRTQRYAKSWLFPSFDSEMGGVIRSSSGEPFMAEAIKQWNNNKDIAFDRTVDVLDKGRQGTEDSQQYSSFMEQLKEQSSLIGQDGEKDLPYRETVYAENIPETILNYSVCGKDYSIHFLGKECFVAYDSFPERLTLFDEEGQAVIMTGSGANRMIELAKLAAYIYNSDGMDLKEIQMLSRICKCMGYSNVERWRLLKKLDSYKSPMLFRDLKKQIPHILKSKKTLCFAWHCIAIDGKSTERELAVFNSLIKEYNLSENELKDLQTFTSSKFAKLPEDQIIREYVETGQRKCSPAKSRSMVFSGIVLIIALYYQFIMDSEDVFSLVMIALSSTVFLLNVPCKEQKEYTDQPSDVEVHPVFVYFLIIIVFVLLAIRLYAIL